jgi:signal transduction histidine kinase
MDRDLAHETQASPADPHGACGGPRRLLLVGGSAREAAVLGTQLQADRGAAYEITQIAEPARARAVLAAGGITCVLIAHAPPLLDAPVFLRSIAGPDGRVPVAAVVIDDPGSDIVAVEAMRAGAQDYAVRSRLTPEGLVRGIGNAIEKVALQSEIERRQQALEAARRHQLELKDELISHVSHELRTPLTAAHQFLTIVLDEIAGPLVPQQREYLEIVLRNARALRDMIEDLMEATRCETGKLTIEPRIVHLEDVARETVVSLAPLAAARRQALSIDVAPDLPPVLADPLRVRQILTNLIENAVKFSAVERPIAVRVQRAPADPDRLEACVEDRGCGIAPDRLPLVFERLHQEPAPELGSRRGLGLGLYISRELARAQGGEIGVDSEPGRGSRFALRLPVFRLESALRPLLQRPDALCSPLFLVTIRLRRVCGGELEERRVRAAHALLQRLVYPERDAVLPRLPAHGACEQLHVVAGADRPGAAAMSRRLRLGLLQMEELAGSDIDVDVHGEALEGLLDRGGDPAERLARIASQVCARIDATRPGHRPPGASD